jgi:chromosome segregation ATPase
MAGTRFVLALCCVAYAMPSRADSNEDRLRDALRQSVTQMRAAQDQAAQAQADLQKAQQDRASVQALLDAANAKLAQGAATPAAPPQDLARLQADLAASRAQGAALQAALAKYQRAYQGVADQARGLDDGLRRAQTGVAAQTAALATCRAENAHLVQTAETILHLYESQDFRGLLLRSYEPLIGTAKVRLENMVQDYDDKIRDQEYIQGAKPR